MLLHMDIFVEKNIFYFMKLPYLNLKVLKSCLNCKQDKQRIYCILYMKKIQNKRRQVEI